MFGLCCLARTDIWGVKPWQRNVLSVESHQMNVLGVLSVIPGHIVYWSLLFYPYGHLISQTMAEECAIRGVSSDERTRGIYGKNGWDVLRY